MCVPLTDCLDLIDSSIYQRQLKQDGLSDEWSLNAYVVVSRDDEHWPWWLLLVRLLATSVQSEVMVLGRDDEFV